MSYALAAYADAPYAAPRGAAAIPDPPAGTLPIIEVGLETDPGVFVDVSVDLISGTTRRGRNAESGAFETGRGVVMLRNESRTYDPENAAGPYYGKLRPNRRVRIRANYGGAAYPVMVGYVDRITQNYPGPNEIVATIAFSDRFKILNKQELPSSAYAAEVTRSAPAHWWRLGDPAGSTVAANQMVPASPLRATAAATAPAFADPSLSVREADGAARFTATQFLQLVSLDSTFPITTAGTIEFLYRKNGAGNDPAVGLYVLAPAGASVAYGVDPVITAGGNVRAFWINNAGVSFDVQTTGVNLNDLATHHIAMTWQAGDTIKIYVDGIDRTAAAVAFTGSMAPPAGAKWAAMINGIDYPPFINTTNGSVATYDEVAVYTAALSAADVAAHNAAARTPWNGDLPGPRIARALAVAGVASTDYDLDPGTTPLQATSLGGGVLAYLQNVADTELGWLFVGRDGLIRFIGRRAGFGDTSAYQTSKATLADETPGATEVPYRAVTLEVDESDIVTRATISRDGSVAVTYEDAAAKAEFGVVPFTAEGLLHNDDAYSASYAQWVVNSRKGPETKVGAVDVYPQRNPTVAFPAMLGLELADRASLKRRPKVGAAISKECRVESISHTFGGKEWAIGLQLSAFNQANDLPVFIWGVTNWGQHVWGL